MINCKIHNKNGPCIVILLMIKHVPSDVTITVGVYVGPHVGTVPVLAPGHLFCPALALWRSHPHVGTMQWVLRLGFGLGKKLAQFQNGVPSSSTGCPKLARCQNGDVHIPVPARGKNRAQGRNWAGAILGANVYALIKWASLDNHHKKGRMVHIR